MSVRTGTSIGAAAVLSASICWFTAATGLWPVTNTTWLSNLHSQWFAGADSNASDTNSNRMFNWRQISHITLTDQDGKPYNPGESKADATLLNFMFTGCTTECPLQTAQLSVIHQRLQAQLSEEQIQFLSVTITPLTDGINTLKAFATRFNVDYPNWRFLRASQIDTSELLQRFAVTSAGADDTQPDHRNVLYLLNGNGDLIQQYAAAPINVDRVSREVAQLVGME